MMEGVRGREEREGGREGEGRRGRAGGRVGGRRTEGERRRETDFGMTPRAGGGIDEQTENFQTKSVSLCWISATATPIPPVAGALARNRSLPLWRPVRKHPTGITIKSAPRDDWRGNMRIPTSPACPNACPDASPRLLRDRAAPPLSPPLSPPFPPSLRLPLFHTFPSSHPFPGLPPNPPPVPAFAPQPPS